MFNKDQVGSFVRSCVIAAGAFFTAKGWIGTELVVEIAGGVAAFAAAAWGLWFHGGATKTDMAEVIVGDADASKEYKVEEQAAKLVK